MKASFWQRGEKIDFENTTSKLIEGGTVLSIGERIAIAGGNIPAGEVGSAVTEGVFICEKTNASDVIERGTDVFFDGTGIVASSEEKEDEDKTLTPAGWAIETSSTDDTTVKVKIG
jgi:predicted RecA/RadA family phage recombinase